MLKAVKIEIIIFIQSEVIPNDGNHANSNTIVI